MFRGSTTRASGGLFARTTQFAGASVLVLGTVLAVPTVMAATAAPAGALVTLPFAQPVITPEVPCGNVEADACTTITITKTDSWTGLPLAGAVFTAHFGDYNSQTNKVTCDTQALATSTESSTAGTYTISPVEEDALYCVTETTTPPGYAATTPPQTGYALAIDDSDGTPNTCPTITGDFGSALTAKDQSPEVATIQDSCVSPVSFKNDPIPVNINISKYIASSGAGLNGATFTLENTDGSAVTTGTGGVVNGAASCLTAGATSTAAGTCSILNIMIAGTYKLHETPPRGYDAVADIPVTVTLGSADIGVVVTNHATVTVPPATAPAAATAVTGATTVHTGESFAGSAPYVAATLALGGSLFGLGLVRRRRHVRRPTA